jgi:hypothetical protein
MEADVTNKKDNNRETPRLPNHFSVFLIRGEEATVEGMGDDEVVPQCNTAIIDAAARDGTRPIVVSLWIHAPDELAGAAVQVDFVD